MLTEWMERPIRLLPDAGAEAPASFVPDYGKISGESAPDMGNAETPAEEPAVGSEGNTATETPTQTESVQTRAWMAQLPKEMRNDPELAQYRTMGDAIKDLKAKAKAVEAEPVASEAEEAQPQGGENIPVNYENFTAKLSEGNDPFGSITSELTEKLQALGIEQAKAEEIVKSLDASQQSATEKYLTEGKKYTESILKKQWGKDYSEKRALMAKGYQALGDSDGSLQRLLDEQGASLSPAVWEVLSRVGRLVSEDKAVGSQAGKAVRPRNPEVPVTYTY